MRSDYALQFIRNAVLQCLPTIDGVPSVASYSSSLCLSLSTLTRWQAIFMSLSSHQGHFRQIIRSLLNFVCSYSYT